MTTEMAISALPQELRERSQWLLHDRKKRPLQSNGKPASTINSGTWTTFENALAACRAKPKRFAGIGFVFTEDDPYIGVDLDDCRHPETGLIEPWAMEIIDSLASYSEVSPSGTGVKIWAKGELPGDGSGRRDTFHSGTVEMYQHGRYFCVTGESVNSITEVRPAQYAITGLWQEVFGMTATAEPIDPEAPDPETTATPEQLSNCRKHILALPPAIQGDRGSDATLRAACEIRRYHIYGEQGRAILDDFNEHCCDPRWSDDELDHKWESARRFVQPAGSEFSEIVDAPLPKVAPPSPYKEFPVDALPEPIREFVATGAKAVGCDAAYIALPLLCVLANAIGASRRLRLKVGWEAPAILWAVIIGESGTAKSPAFRLALKAIRERENLALARYAELVARYEDELTLYRKPVAQPDGEPNAASDPLLKPVPLPKPLPPRAERFIVSDTTVEALAALLVGNLRGVLLARDELAGWIGSFDRYINGKGGGDVSHWLSMHNGDRICVDRKTGNHPTIAVPQACVSITGGIQPGILDRALGVEHRESGLAARLLLAYPPRHAKQWTESEIDPAVEAAVARVVNRLYELQPAIDMPGKYTPVFATLSAEAKAVWIEFYDAHAMEQATLHGELAAAWSKLEEYAARLALVIHYARWAAAELSADWAAVEAALFAGHETAGIPVGDDANRLSASPNVIDAESIGAAVRLVEWFKYEAKRVYSMLGESSEATERRRLTDWIAGKGGSVTERDTQRGCRWLSASGRAEAALQDLSRRGLGIWESSPRDRPGKPTRRFVLNPVNGISANPAKESIPSTVDGRE